MSSAVPDAHADMTQSDMWERVCNLERANRLIFKDFNKKVSDQHNDCLRRIGESVEIRHPAEENGPHTSPIPKLLWQTVWGNMCNVKT